MLALALVNWAAGGTVPVCPDGLTVTFCGVPPEQVHSRVSWPLSYVARSRHLPVPTFFSGVAARTLYSQVCAGELLHVSSWIFVPFAELLPVTSRHLRDLTFRRCRPLSSP